MKGANRFLVVVSVVVVLTGASWTAADHPTVVAEVQLGQSTCCSLTGVAVNLHTNQIYVADLGKDVVYVVDGYNYALVDEVAIPGRPFGVAADPFNNLIYVSSIDDEAIYVVDGWSNSIVDMIDLPHTPLRLEMNFITNRLYAANPASRCVCEIDCDTHVVDDIPLDPRPQGLGVNLLNDDLWVGHGSACVSVVDETASVEPIHMGSRPWDVAVNPLIHRAYACDRDTEKIYSIDTRTQQSRPLALDGMPTSVAVNPLSRRVYTTLADGVLKIIDSRTERVTAAVPVGDAPWDVTVDPLRDLVYLVSFIDGKLYVIRDESSRPPQRVITNNLNHLLVEVSTTVNAAPLVALIQNGIAVLRDSDPGNDFMAAVALMDLIEEVEASGMPPVQAEPITFSARRILTMFFGG